MAPVSTFSDIDQNLVSILTLGREHMRRGPHAAGGRFSYADCFVVCRLLSCYRLHSCIWLHLPPARYLRATHPLCAQLCSCRLSACTCHTTATLTNDLVVAGTFYDARSLSCHPRRQHPLLCCTCVTTTVSHCRGTESTVTRG